MILSILVSNRVIKEGFDPHRKTDFAVSCKQAIDLVGLIISQSNECEVYATSQAIDKNLGFFANDEQRTKFRNFFKSESTTQGVNPYNADTSTEESAKTLALESPTLVIIEEEGKKNISPNERIRALSPVEFISLYEKSKALNKVIQEKELDLAKLLVFLIFSEQESIN